MPAIHWLNPISGSFTNATDWSGGIVPGASDDAILDAAGVSLYTVTASGGGTIDSLQTAGNATFDVTQGHFYITNGTGGGRNAGTIVVATNATLTLEGVVENTGAIELAGELYSEEGVLTLTGGGRIDINAGIYGDEPFRIAGFSTVINVDNTISGAGELGNAFSSYAQNFINESAGTIDGTGQGFSLDFQTVTNTGLMEAAAGGGLGFSSTVDNAGGTILASNNGVVSL